MANLLGDMMVRILADTKDFSHSIDESQKQFLAMGQALGRSSETIAEAFRRINGEAAVWGQSTDLISQKQEALKREISSLIAQGIDPLSPRIEKLQNEYYKLGDQSKALAESQKPVLNNWQKMKGQISELDQALGGFGTKITKLLANPLILAATAIVAVGKAFVDTTKELVKYGATIQTANERTGISIKALQEYKFVAEQTGGSLESITASIKMMTRGLESNADTFKALGIATRDSTGQFRSAEDIFADTIGALGNLSNDTERANLALKLFGRGAIDMVPLLKEGSKGLEELKQKAHDLGLVMSDETIVKAHDLEKSTDALKASWKVFTMGLVQDSIPGLMGINKALSDILILAKTGIHLSALEESAKSLSKNKTDIVAYHDVLVELIATNQKLAAGGGLNATYALGDIVKYELELEKIAPEYGKQKASLDALNGSRDSAAKYIADKAAADMAEKVRLNMLRDLRDTAQKEYEDSIKRTAQLTSSGLRTTEQAQKDTTEATRKYAEALVPIVAASGDNKIGAEALAEALAKLALGDNSAAESALEFAISQQIAENALKNRSEAMNAYTVKQKAYWEAWAAIAAKANAKVRAEDQKTTEEQKAYWETWAAIAAKANAKVRAEDQKTTEDAEENQKKINKERLDGMLLASSAMKSTLSQMGQDLVKGELSWKSLGTAAIRSIGAIVSAVGDQLAAKAAAALVEAMAASVNPLLAWAAPGLYQSAAIQASGAAVAWTAGAALQAVSLARGGVASSPTLAMIGDNSRYPEVVSPLSPSFFANIGEGILGALAARSSQAPASGVSGAASFGAGMSSSDLDSFAAKVAARMTTITHVDLDGKEIAKSTTRYQDNNLAGRRK